MTQVGFVWTDGDNGGKPITDYRIEKFENDEWQVIEQTQQKQYLATELQPGVNHKFRVSALNEVGYSLVSEEIQILTAVIPQAPTDVVTQVEANDIIITWQHESDDFYNDYGANLISYTIMIQSKDEVTFYPD